MNDLLFLFGILVALTAILVNITLWAPRRLRVKLGALATAALMLPVGYAAMSELLARPKPITAEWARQSLAEAAVIGARMDEGKAIYVWLALPDVEEPRAYALPWNKKLARQLRGAQRAARDSGAQVRMRKPFESSLDRREQVFYAAPPPPPPLKAPPLDNPLDFQRSQSGDDDASNN